MLDPGRGAVLDRVEPDALEVGGAVRQALEHIVKFQLLPDHIQVPEQTSGVYNVRNTEDMTIAAVMVQR